MFTLRFCRCLCRLFFWAKLGSRFLTNFLPQDTFLKASRASCIKLLWQNIALWERMLWHQKNWRIWNPPNWIDNLFMALIFITENTLLFNFSNGHFWPTPLSFMSNTPSLTLLICRTFSLFLSLSLNSPLFLHLLWFHLNAPLIWWDGITVINWMEVNGSFTGRLLTIL